MKIIHQNGFTTEELMTFRPIIYRNTIDSAQAIVIQMRNMNVECETPANRVSYLLNSTLSTQAFPAAMRRSHHRISGRKHSQLHLLCRHCPSHSRHVAGSRHSKGHGPLQRILPNGLSKLVSGISRSDSKCSTSSQFLYRGAPDRHPRLYANRK